MTALSAFIPERDDRVVHCKGLNFTSIGGLFFEVIYIFSVHGMFVLSPVHVVLCNCTGEIEWTFSCCVCP